MKPTEPGSPPTKHQIQTLCSQMSGFCYDSAKDIAEKERDASKSAKPPLAGLFAAFAHLCVIEKQYYSLSFLMPRRYFMKDTSLVSVYNSVLNDLKKVAEWKTSKSTGEMAVQLMSFVQARLELLAFYDLIATTGASSALAESSASEQAPPKPLEKCVLPLDDVLFPKICGIVKKYYECLSHDNLRPLSDLFQWELDALHGLISCLHHMNHWRYFESLIEVDKSKRALLSWQQSLQTHTESKASRLFSSSWFSSRPTSPTPSELTSVASHEIVQGVEMAPTPEQPSNAFYVEPALYSWLNKLRLAVLSKFSLYFYDVLLVNTTPEDMKENCSKLSHDYAGKILTNVKRLDLSYVVLIFDASSEPNYKGPGVHHPGIQKETPRGLNLYPTAFSCPERPSNHLPAFVMCIDEYSNDLDTCNKILFYYDSRADTSYYLLKIEAKMTLGVVCQNKRAEKDAGISSFMIEIANQLRGCKILASIKPGYKS